ncbi:hypothetical protein [Thermus caldilimi]|nr:hypothetical protein [Thermus caldilimi]
MKKALMLGFVLGVLALGSSGKGVREVFPLDCGLDVKDCPYVPM